MATCLCQFELDLLAQRAELIQPEWFCSAFRASNLQGALQLMEELQQSPITYQPQQHRPDARGHSTYACSSHLAVWCERSGHLLVLSGKCDFGCL